MIVGIDPSFTSMGISDGRNSLLIKTSPTPTETQAQSLIRRCNLILDSVNDFLSDGHHTFYIEAPMLNAMGGSHHLYDLGWLMKTLYDNLGESNIVEVTPTTLKKYIAGKGNAKKDEMKLWAFKRWAVEFEQDPGADKLHAYALHRYGVDVASGAINHIAAARRGLGGKKKAA